MKRTYKHPAMLLAALIFSSACTACGDTAHIPAETTNSDTVSTTAVTEPAAPEYTAPEVDYAGETFTIGAIALPENSSPWKAVDYCEIFSSEENGDPLNDAIYQRNLAVSEALNVNIECYPYESFDRSISDFTKVIMAGEDIIDISLSHSWGMPNLLGTGALVDLLTLPNVDFTHSWWDQKSGDELKLGDSMYSITGDISLYISYAPIVYYFNKALVNELSLDDPYTLVKDGKWTIEQLQKMASEAAADLNGDGAMTEKEDRYGLLCQADSLAFAAYAADVSITDKDGDGMPYLNVDIERAASVCEKMVPFMNDGNVTLQSYATTKGSYGNIYFDLFLPMFCENRALFFTNQLMVALNLRDMDADFGIIPTPKYDETQKDYMCPISDWWATFLVVPVTNSNYDMTGHVIEALGYYGQQYIRPAYFETTIQGKTLRDEASIEMLNLILNNRVYDLASFYNWGNVFQMYNTIAANTRLNYASEYAKIEKKAQAALDETIELLRSES